MPWACGQYVRYAAHIIRGLDYYTGTVFEAWDVAGEFRAIVRRRALRQPGLRSGRRSAARSGLCHGRRGNWLAAEEAPLLPAAATTSPAPVLVTVFDESTLLDSLRLASELRQAGLNVACYPEAAKLARQFKFADRSGIKIVLVVGPDEAAAGKVTVKDLRNGTQHTLMRGEAASFIKKMLENSAAANYPVKGATQ